jgi:hypothetical protein
MTEEAKAAFAKRYEEGETGEMMGRPEGGPPASIFRSEPPFFGWIA